MKLRDLFVRIGFDVDEKPVKQLESSIKDLKFSILEIGTAVVAAGASLFALAKSAANAGEYAKKMSQSLGLTVESFQELEYAASLSEVSAEEFQISMRRMADTASNAARGIKTDSQSFQNLGISVMGANGNLKASDQLLAEIADKFARMPNSLEKTALANDLFGRSGAYLIPLLNEGSAGIAKLRQEARDLGIVMSTEDAVASDDFGDSIIRLMAAIKGIKNQIGLGLIPVLTEIVSGAQGWIMANRELVRSTLAEYIQKTVTILRSMYVIVRGVVDTVKDLATAFGGLNTVIRYVIAALLIFKGLEILYAVGSMVQAIWKLTSAFMSLGAAAIMSKLAIAAVPLLIGIGIAALILLLEDVIAYFQGRNSITGLLIEAFQKKLPTAFQVVKAVINALKTDIIIFWNLIKAVALLWAGIFHLDLGAIKEGLHQVYSIFSNVFSSIGRVIKDALTSALDFISSTSAYKSISWLFGKISDVLAWTSGPAQEPFSSTPASAPIASSVSTHTVNAPQNMNINSPITVNVPPGTPAQDVGPRVRAGVKDALGEVLRQTYWATSPGLEW
ncbi:MAG: hypothetical protein AB1847_17585 [bacterium]